MLDAAPYCCNLKGYGFAFQTNSIRTASSSPRCCPNYVMLSCACGKLAHERTFARNYAVSSQLNHSIRYGLKGTPVSSCAIVGGGVCFMKRRRREQFKFRIRASIEVSTAVDVINDLGLDTLTFLAVTVLVVPAFRTIKASPILGFFFAGVVLNQFGFIRNLTDVKVLSEWGILFLLFEMGLELSLARLKALAKFAFGLGLSQVLLSTLAFTAFELPPNGAIGTRVLEFLFHSRPDLVNIRSVDEAVVIGAALSLSSSAFVLQLLAEKGELPTRFGSATLGILLLQDIAVVPLLVILPVLESQNIIEESLWPMLVQESLKALLGLGLLSLGGKYLLRRVFEVVAETRSSEAFVALCLLTVAGTSLITQKLGFSDTLGAFLAGAILAETNFRTQIEADIRPFRGLLLGLFFVTTGTSIDMQILIREWPNIFSLLVGLIVIKTLIITAIGPRVGLTLQESVRLGFLLSQGGEFAFVVFSLANRLGVLPLELNKLLIIVVVLSMALTPLLNEIGRKAASYVGEKFEDGSKADDSVNFDASEPVVIVGFGQKAQVLANLLSTPLAVDGNAGWPFVAFDLDPSIVKKSRKLGFPVLYGDGSRPAVLQSAGVNSPKAVMIMYTEKQRTTEAVQRIRLAYPGIPIYARAQDMMHLLDLKKAGATDAILENAETSFQLGSKLLKGLGVMSDEVSFLSQQVRDSMELQAIEALEKTEDQELTAIMKPLQVRVVEVLGENATSNGDEESSLSTQSQKDGNKPYLDDEEDGKGVRYCDIESEDDAQPQSHTGKEVNAKNTVGVANQDSDLRDSSLESYDRELVEQIGEKRIRDAAEEASFLLDFWAVRCLPSNPIGKRSLLLDGSNPWSMRRVTEEIGLINEELNNILYNKEFQDFEHMSRSATVESLSSLRTSRSFTDAQTKLVGLEGDVIALLDALTGSSPQLKIYPVIGMAGIGKTTLADLLYDDPLVKHHFYLRAWVTVSQRYDIKEMLLSVLIGVMSNHSDEICLKTDEELRELAYRSLKGKRYLIVLDDIWDTKAWDDLRRIFPDDKNGSRIILTSRLRDVAVHVSPDSSPHLLQCLGENDSWELLHSKIFGNKACPLDLEATGKQIARKCRGLPLAIVVIGGLLSKMKDKLEVWDNIAQRLSAVAMKDADNCQNILALGYYHLPDYLKPCFLYMGIFPEDYEIPVKKLIWLWIAEGFITSRNLKSLEQVAEEYLENLIARNLVLVKAKSSDGKNKICYVHDLMRDLCVGESRERNFFHVIESYEQNLKQGSRNLQRLSFHSSFCKYIGTQSFPYTKSLIGFESLYLSGRQLRLDMNLKLLKVLYLMNVRLRTVPEEIRRLTRLKLVAISVQNPLNLTQFSSMIHSVQTFIVDSKWDVQLTSSFWNMPELRHFQLTQSCLSYHPMTSASEAQTEEDKQLRVLNNLQSLYAIRPISCIKKVFLCMPNLKKLGVHETEEDHRFHGWLKKLVYLRELEKLKYTFCNPFISPNLKPGPLPYNFPTKLSKLTLSGTSYPWEDMLKLSRLPNLEVLKLRNYAFSGPIWRCNEGGFRKLGFLMINCTDLETWECEGRDHFPRLKHLVLRHCRLLKEIPCGTFGHLPLLESITLHCCNDLDVSSVIDDIQEEQVNMGNEGFKLFITER